jgi:lysyl-tRNA synthetase class 1
MGGMKEAGSNYWLDQVAAKAMELYPEGEIVVESGHAPSGYYHIGTLREILTASAIAWRINKAGRKAIHIDFVDDVDALRKVPAGVPEEWGKYVGRPLYIVPDPTGKHESWSAWLTSGLYAALEQMGLQPEVRYAHIEYPKGTFARYIEMALEQMEKGRSIISELSKRELPEDWSPVQILSDSGSLREWEFEGWDKDKGVVKWRDRDGQTGEVSYKDGRVKLDWRFDWPARWMELNVAVEPFGRDHASSGGSYDTGARIITEIFGGKPPMPVPYDFINRVGETKKMSKSAGDVVTVEGALEIMPPEIVRYFVLRSMPSRMLKFDEGLGLYNLVDEFAKVQQAVAAGEHPEFEQAYLVAVAQTVQQTISSVPFGHLVQSYQAARRDVERTLEMLERSGYKAAVAGERDVIVRELKFVTNWLDKYAPESVKFQLQDKLPEVELTQEQQAFLGTLASAVEQDELSAQGMHDAVYAAAEASKLKPGQAFVSIYRVVLGKDSGPKAGWFLSELDRSWLVARLREGSSASAE